VFEELASNGLRHGRCPVRAQVAPVGDDWLVVVTDSAPDRPPTPAPDRDPARGGLGLQVIARLCAAYGWTSDEDREHVWGRVRTTG
jgi:two-component sensor histidine kinase